MLRRLSTCVMYPNVDDEGQESALSAEWVALMHQAIMPWIAKEKDPASDSKASIQTGIEYLKQLNSHGSGH